MTDDEYRPTWKFRRIALFACIIWCLGILTWLLVWGPQEKADLGFWGILSFLVAIIGSYVFGAAWEWNKWRGKP